MRPTLTIRNPDVESLIRGLPSVGADDWDSVRPWAQAMVRARNDWSIRTAKDRIPNSLGRKKHEL